MATHELNITTGQVVKDYLKLMNNEQLWDKLMTMEGAHDRLYYPFFTKLNPFPENYHDKYHHDLIKSREDKVINYLKDRDAFELFEPGLTMSVASERYYQKYCKPNEEQYWENNQKGIFNYMKENNLEKYYYEGMEIIDAHEMFDNPVKREEVFNQIKNTGKTPYQIKLDNDLKGMGNLKSTYLAGAPEYVRRLYTGSTYY